MLRIFFLLLLAIAVTDVYCQHGLPDSLRRRLADVPLDSTYVDMLNALATKTLGTNPAGARSISSHVLETASQLRYTRGYARALTIIGNSYWYEGVYEFAQNQYLLAARQYQSINDSIGLGQTYNNIGEVYKKLNENEKALEYLLRSTELKKKDAATRAITLYNIGELYIKLGQLDKGRRYISDSYAIAKRENNKRVIAYNLWSFAAIRVKENNPDGALAYLLSAEEIWREIGDIRSLIQTYQEMAGIYSDQRNFQKAEEYLLKAVELGRQIRVPDLQVKNYRRFARLDSLRGDYFSSLYYLSRHNMLKDSVYNLLKAEQIARLQTIYETEGREHENRQLRVEKELRDAQLSMHRISLLTISVGLLIAGVLAWVNHRQRKRISFQKEAIEAQAVALLKLNEELQDLNKTLEARIDERTSQLTIQNTRLAEYTFINAHKLRAPVASILGLINIMPQVNEQERTLVMEHLKSCGEELDHVIREVSRGLESAIVAEEPA